MKRILFAGLVCLITISFALSAFAAAPLTVDIHGPGQRLVTLTLLPPKGIDGAKLPDAQAKAFEDLVANNLSYIPFLKLVPFTDILGGDPSKGIKGSDLDYKPMQLARIDLCMTTGWKDNRIEARVFETFSGRRLVGKLYNDIDKTTLTLAADRFSSALLEALSGKKGFFNSPIAFVRKEVGEKGETSKEIFTVLPQGRALKRITKLGGYNLSPAWSEDGEKIVFTHIGKSKHRLGVFDGKTRKIRLYTRGLGQTIISPIFGPDDVMYASLNRNGSTNIFDLKQNMTPGKTLGRSPYIDVSPSFDRSGNKMVFTSGRAGNPHIYLMDMKTKRIRRVTMKGKYNTHPCISPNGRYVAYTHRTSNGHRIFVHDLTTGREKQLTFGPGNDEYPAFGPDGYFVAFASNRSGEYKLYLSTRHGDTPRRLSTGKGPAYAPAWDTSLQR